MIAKYRPSMPIVTLVVPHLCASKGLKWELQGLKWEMQVGRHPVLDCFVAMCWPKLLAHMCANKGLKRELQLGKPAVLAGIIVLGWSGIAFSRSHQHQPGC
eukprot:1157376-Pelagomonas_calceolata.AAC.8